MHGCCYVACGHRVFHVLASVAAAIGAAVGCPGGVSQTVTAVFWEASTRVPPQSHNAAAARAGKAVCIRCSGENRHACQLRARPTDGWWSAGKCEARQLVLQPLQVAPRLFDSIDG